MPDQDKVQFLPFHAINEFMRTDYRLAVVRSVLLSLPELPDTLRRPIENLTKKLVQVPGFRHSDKAPARVRVIPTADAFEKNPHLVSAILAAWAETRPALRQNVYDLLTSRGWEVLPLEVERAKLPGFGIHWKKGESFDVLANAYKEMYAESEIPSNDDISLMIVWVAARLPFPEAEEEDPTADAPTPGSAGSPP